MRNASEFPDLSQKRNTTDNILSSPVLWSKSTLTLAVVELLLRWVVNKVKTRPPTWPLQGSRWESKPAINTFSAEWKKLPLIKSLK